MRSAVVIETDVVAIKFQSEVSLVYVHLGTSVQNYIKWIKYDNHDWTYFALVEPRQGVDSAYSFFFFSFDHSTSRWTRLFS